jgi:hypothetical protein
MTQPVILGRLEVPSLQLFRVTGDKEPPRCGLLSGPAAGLLLCNLQH